VRVALSGRAASPGIFEITAIIGKGKTLERLRRAIAHITSQE
jgi:glutamyl-tRNA synthetase